MIKVVPPCKALPLPHAQLMLNLATIMKKKKKMKIQLLYVLAKILVLARYLPLPRTLVLMQDLAKIIRKKEK